MSAREQDDSSAEPITKALSKFVAPSLFEVAEAMQAEYPVYFDRSGNFWIWDETHYTMVDDIEVLLALRGIIDDEKRLLGNGKHAVLDAIKMSGRARCVEDVPKTWIHLQDTIIDIETGLEIKPSADYLLTAPSRIDSVKALRRPRLTSCSLSGLVKLESSYFMRFALIVYLTVTLFTGYSCCLVGEGTAKDSSRRSFFDW